MKLVVRQMAWLNATPKPDDRTKRAQIGAEVAQVSRLARFKADKIKPQMPPNPLPHIVDRLVEIGLNEQAGMGVAPLSWSTIDAWTRLTGIDLMPWEVRLIRSLSVAYLSEGSRAESENCPPPWRGTWTARNLEVEQSRLEELLG
ncbi:hypothetical protein H5J25_13870 [Sphingomonas aliaeris]|uniref:Uncharacterized protein n=1 Tax=Sphingomonas aliaeris TaxID=2759526 RepID=A0A974NXV7_9SPHN|nr:hypothetical protein H5J25_13870 [Sphingomonas aliaeris]